MTRSGEMVIVALKAMAHHNGKDGFANSGRLNAYSCHDSGFARDGKGCKATIVTIDREPGVTPFLTKCPKCGGMAQSHGYQVPPTLSPTHEWFRPDNFDGLSDASADHVRRGGLIMREIANV